MDWIGDAVPTRSCGTHFSLCIQLKHDKREKSNRKTKKGMLCSH